MVVFVLRMGGVGLPFFFVWGFECKVVVDFVPSAQTRENCLSRSPRRMWMHLSRGYLTFSLVFLVRQITRAACQKGCLAESEIFLYSVRHRALFFVSSSGMNIPLHRDFQGLAVPRIENE